MLQSTKLYCGGEGLAALDVSDSPRLQELRCSDSAGLRTLRLGRQEALAKLDCANTGIGELDVSGCPNLREFACGELALERFVTREGHALHLRAAGGAVSLSDYEPATARVRLTASAGGGARFAGWLGLPGDAVAAHGSCAFTLDRDVSVGALFESARERTAFWWAAPCGDTPAAKAPLCRALP